MTFGLGALLPHLVAKMTCFLMTGTRVVVVLVASCEPMTLGIGVETFLLWSRILFVDAKL